MNEQLSYFNGRDGFSWWIGVVEDRADPETVGRVRVRVFGYHTDDKTKLPTQDLPWAHCIQPANSASAGGVGSSPTGPIEGTWVIGFWRDPDFFQEPMVFGTLPGKPQSAPQGSAPPTYDPEQRPGPPTVETVTFTGDGRTVEFEVPDTTDAAVSVTVGGDVVAPTNPPPTSPSNVVAAPVFEGGKTYTPADFPNSSHARQLAEKLNTVAPWVRDRFANAINHLITNNEGYDCGIGFAYRSNALQAELRARYEAGGPKAARPGNSWHNWACAIDLTIYVNGRYDDGTRGNNYLGLARQTFAPYGLKNDIPNDSGHFYPVEFSKGVPAAVKNGSMTVAEYAQSVGLDTSVA